MKLEERDLGWGTARLLDPGVSSNLLPGPKKATGGGGIAATCGGALRDGTPIAVKRLGKTCCRQEEAQFLRGLKLLAELRHDNVVSLRGFCCSRAREECYLVYNLVPNGSLSQFLDVAERSSVPVDLDWLFLIVLVSCTRGKPFDLLKSEDGRCFQRNINSSSTNLYVM